MAPQHHLLPAFYPIAAGALAGFGPASLAVTGSALSGSGPASSLAVATGGTRRRGMLSVASPGGSPLDAIKGGRLAVVAALPASAAPGAGDNTDRAAVVSAYRLEMQLFKMSEKPVAFLGGEPTDLLAAASATAQDCNDLMLCLLGNETVPPHVFKELISVGRAFVVVEGQSKEGYLRADAIINAIHGLKLVDKVFFSDAKLSGHTPPAVPPSGQDLHKESFFLDLVNLFVLCYTKLYWEANGRYGFDKRD